MRDVPTSSSAPIPAVRAVLIDMDDTIFDHSLTCRAAIAALRRGEPYLRRRSLGELWSEYLGLLDAISPSVLSGAVSVEAARIERWRRIALACGARLSPAEARELSQEYRSHYQRLRRAVPGAKQLLERLHDEFPVVVVTNNEVAEQEEKVRFLGIGSLIDGLVVSQAVGSAKPDGRIFRVALGLAGVPPEEATMFGDSWTSDVLGARGVGVRPVWFNRFHRPSPDHGSVAEVRSLRPLQAARETILGATVRAPAGTRARASAL